MGSIVVTPDLATYCPDLATWPTSWCGEERDVIAGEHIVAVFTPFLLDLLAQGLSRKTLNLHRDNLWLLGGEIIRDINDAPKLRKRPVAELIREAIANDEHGGSILDNEFFERQLQKVREIRLSERKFYQKITDIYATSLDYDPRATATKRFFAAVQNKLHYAIHGQTAAEAIVDRADYKSAWGQPSLTAPLPHHPACGSAPGGSRS